MKDKPEPWVSADPKADLDALLRLVEEFTARVDQNPVEQVGLLLGELRGYKRVLSSLPRAISMPATALSPHP